MDFLKCNSRSPQLELHYFLCFLIKNLSNIEITKLTIAPKVAKIIVFKTSSDSKFGIILKNVPPAVPTKAELLLCTGIVFIGCCQLANSRNNATSNGNVATK